MKRILEIQKQIGTLGKNAKNPFFKSAYLDLAELLIHVTPIINDNGLILIQPIVDGCVGSQLINPEDGKVLVESFIPLPDLKDPQKLGGAITYFRRYTLKSLLAIAEVDDDGNLASKPEPKAKEKLTGERFDKALKMFETGAITKESILKFDLTDVQKKALNLSAVIK